MKMLLATCSLVSAVSRKEPLPKRRYMKLLQSSNAKVQSKCSNCEATTPKLVDSDAKVEELELKVRLLMDETEKIGEFQK